MGGSSWSLLYIKLRYLKLKGTVERGSWQKAVSLVNDLEFFDMDHLFFGSFLLLILNFNDYPRS